MNIALRGETASHDAILIPMLTLCIHSDDNISDIMHYFPINRAILNNIYIFPAALVSEPYHIIHFSVQPRSRNNNSILDLWPTNYVDLTSLNNY